VINCNGKNALVTGAGRGLGREIALRLASAGANVGVCDIDFESVKNTAREIESLGKKSVAFQADVSKSSDVLTMFDGLMKTFPTIDILVNNAGITRDNLIIRMKEEDWDLVMDINCKSAFLLCKEASKYMLKSHSGKIINISSVVGTGGNAAQVNYSASKAGLIGITKTLAKEFAKKNIQVNAIAPGFIKTPMTEKLSPEAKAKLMADIPMQQLGLPIDVANAVVFLSSSLSDYITGIVLPVDGGISM
jgi:3-oxoacyl-[acyl-carrier protein] reductase